MKPKELDHATLDYFDHTSADAVILDELENTYGWTYDDNASLRRLAVILVEVLVIYPRPLETFVPKSIRKWETRRLLASSEALQPKVKECWKKRNFEEIRTLVILHSPHARPPPKRCAPLVFEYAGNHRAKMKS